MSANLLTWGLVRAMERSHSWRTTRGMEPRACAECGDGETSDCRYCPGPQPTIKAAS